MINPRGVINPLVINHPLLATSTVHVVGIPSQPPVILKGNAISFERGFGDVYHNLHGFLLLPAWRH